MVEIVAFNITEKILTTSPKQLVIGSFTVLAVYKFLKFVKNKLYSYKINKMYKANAIKFRTERDDKLKKFYNENNNLYSEKDKNEIRLASLSELKVFLENGKYSSETIVKVLLLRNYEFLSHNFAADINIEETISLAIKSDEIRRKINDSSDKETQLKEFPLLGLPLSFKDVFTLKNFHLIQGYACNLDLPSNTTDSYIVEILKKKGAVPLIKSSVPQGIFAYDTENLIFGQAINPFDKTRTTGGSSGGEAGLISTNCSAAGFGSDLGGSILVPSHFCGIYGFKPTSMRISKKGTLEFDNNKTLSPYNMVRGSYGPMARSFDDILLLTSNIVGSFTQDLYCNNIRFNHESYSKTLLKKKYKIAVISQNMCKTTEPVACALKFVIEGMKSNKIDNEFIFEEFPFKDYNNLAMLCFRLSSCSKSFEMITEALKGENIMPHFENYKKMQILPRFMSKNINIFLALTGNKRLKNILENFNTTDVNLKEYFNLIRKFEQFKNEFIKIYQENDYDAIISPVAPFPALKHGHSNDLFSFFTYDFVFNYLDFPAGVIPVSKSMKVINKYDDGINDLMTKKIRENLEGCENLPVGIQISTLTNQDESCLAMMEKIDRILKQQNLLKN